MNLSNAARLDGADRCGRKIKDAPQDVFDHTAARTARRTARGQPLLDPQLLKDGGGVKSDRTKFAKHLYST